MNDYRKPYQDTSKRLQARLGITHSVMKKNLPKADKIELQRPKLAQECHNILDEWEHTLQQDIPGSIRSHSSELKNAQNELYKIKSWTTWWWPIFVARTEIVLLYIKIGISTVLYVVYSVLRFFYINRGPTFAGIMLVIFLYLVINMISWPIKPETLKRLHNPNAPVTVKFWLNSENKTKFSADDKVTLYYEISYDNANDFNHDTPTYLTLINVSPTGILSIIVDNKPVKAEKVYLLSETYTDWQHGEQLVVEMDTLLFLQKGREYFKAIVTSEPIALKSDIEENLQRVAFWGTWELTVLVD
jgi:hypothetical protein